MRILSFIFMLLLPCVSMSMFDKNKAEGFHWYTEDSQDKPTIKPLTYKPALQRKKELTPYQELKKLRDDMHNKIAEAILRPSIKSTYNYMKVQQDLTKKNAEFVRHWQQVLLLHPELDHRLNFPTNNSAIAHKNDQEKSFIKKILTKGAKTYGLILFYQGNSVSSQKLVPSLMSFVKENKFSMISVSTDGKAIEGLPSPRSIPLKIVKNKIDLNPKYMPALFLVNIKTRKIRPLTYGYVATSEIKERFLDIATDFKRFSYQGLGDVQ